MKRKLKKLWLLPLSAVAITPLAVVACGNGSTNKPNPTPNNTDKSEIEKFAEKDKADKFNINDELNKKIIDTDPSQLSGEFSKKGTVYTYQNGQYKDDAYGVDKSASYGSYLKLPYDNSSATLIRKQDMFSPIIKQSEDGNYLVYRPSVWKFKLELAEKVIVTDKNGTDHVYDNDNIDVFPDPDVPGKPLYKYVTYRANSTDTKSINSSDFETNAKKAQKIRIVLRKNVKWTDSNGDKTKYEVVPEDIYISWMRTLLLGTNEREKYLALDTNPHENVEKMDELAHNLLDKSSKYFTERRSYPNAYLLKLYGVDYEKFSDENEFLTDWNGEKVATFNARKSKGIADFNAFMEWLADTNEFNLAPSQFIADQAKKQNAASEASYDFKDMSGGVNSEANQKALYAELKKLDPESIISKSGIYWYGINNDKLLYAGAYYFVGYNSNNGELTYRKNKNYWDKDFVASKKRVNEITYLYKNSIKDEVFENQLFDGYKKGQQLSASYSKLSKNDKSEVEQNPLKYNLTYVQEFNSSQLPNSLTWNLTPSTEIDSQYMNDNFAKLMWGQDLTTLKAGTASGKSAYENLVAGFGLQFRSLLSAAINWDALQLQTTNNTADSWNAVTAPNTLIGGTDQANSLNKQPLDVADDINALWALDSSFNKLDLNTKNGNEIKPSMNKKAALAESDVKNKIKSAKFDLIKAQMKKLLDEFYNANSLNESSDKIEWTQVHRYTSWLTSSEEGAVNKFVEVINSLDPRLKFSYKIYEEKNDRPKFFDAILGGAPATWIGWSSDFNEITSQLDGITSQGLRQILALIGSDSDAQDKLKASFPNLVAAAKAFVEYTKDSANEINLSIPFDKLNMLSFKEVTDSINDEIWISKKYDSNTNTLVDIPKSEIGTYTDLSYASASFWHHYATELSNDELIKLVKEFTNYLGIVYRSDANKTIGGFLKTMINPHYKVAFPNGMNWVADYVLWENEE